MDAPEFPADVIALLQQATWDSQASRGYEMFAGGFHWSDEFPGIGDYIEHGGWGQAHEQTIASFRYLIAYRASLIRGCPREKLRSPWDQLARECPDWPGFRPERCSPDLATELNATSEERGRGLEELNERYIAACSKKS